MSITLNNPVHSGPVTVVVGGQFGSEAKGHVTAQLVQEYPEKTMVVRVGGPNAGHSAVGILDGVTYALRQIPVAAVVRLDAQLMIAAGSEIDPDVLEYEINLLDKAGYQVSDRLLIDGQATVIDDHHKSIEQGTANGHIDLHARYGSTAKGVGAARAARIMRDAQLWQDDPLATNCVEHGVLTLRRWLKAGNRVVIEGTQGFGLGTHAGHYPYCTTSDCRAIDFLSMVGISPWAPEVRSLTVWVVLRTYPIRVAGNSGDLYGEKTWEEMREVTGISNLKPELTTVTKKERRIGEFDWSLARRSIIENGGDNCNIALTFMDYVDPILRETGKLGPAGERFISKVQSMAGTEVRMITWGPDLAAQVHLDPLTHRVTVNKMDHDHG